MVNILEWIGREKQREDLGIIKKYLLKIHETVDGLENAFAFYFNDKFDEKNTALAKVKTAEHQADLLRRKILDEIKDGGLVPPNREDLMSFVKKLDTIADYANAAGKLLKFFNFPLPKEISTKLYEYAKLILLATAKIQEAVDYMEKEEGKVLPACTEIEIFEKRGDEIKNELLDLFLDSKLKCPQLIFLNELIEALEKTLDRTEDSADWIRILVIK